MAKRKIDVDPKALLIWEKGDHRIVIGRALPRAIVITIALFLGGGAFVSAIAPSIINLLAKL